MIIKDHLGKKREILNNVINLVAFIDLDGTLTDGTIRFDGDTVSRQYYTQDSHAMNHAKEYGIFPVIVTSSYITAGIKQRFLTLDVPIFTAYNTRKTLVPEVCDLIQNFTTAHIGDDINDEQLLRSVDYPFVPSNVNPELLDKIRDIAFVCTNASGGYGAVREYLYTLVNNYGAERLR